MLTVLSELLDKKLIPKLNFLSKKTSSSYRTSTPTAAETVEFMEFVSRR